MKEIDDPIPREHAACIVRAAEINKLIINTGKCMRAEHLVGIEEAFSTVMGYLESADTHPPLPPSDGGVAVAHYMDMAQKICTVIEGAVAGTDGEPEKVTLAELTASGPAINQSVIDVLAAAKRPKTTPRQRHVATTVSCACPCDAFVFLFSCFSAAVLGSQ